MADQYQLKFSQCIFVSFLQIVSKFNKHPSWVPKEDKKFEIEWDINKRKCVTLFFRICSWERQGGKAKSILIILDFVFSCRWKFVLNISSCLDFECAFRIYGLAFLYFDSQDTVCFHRFCFWNQIGEIRVNYGKWRSSQ